MKLEKRIGRLEARFRSDNTILRMRDGSVREICGRDDYLPDLFAAALGGAHSEPPPETVLLLGRGEPTGTDRWARRARVRSHATPLSWPHVSLATLRTTFG